MHRTIAVETPSPCVYFSISGRTEKDRLAAISPKSDRGVFVRWCEKLSFRPDVGCSHDLGPCLGFFDDELREVGGRTYKRLAA
jgi:hypothetical protein